MDPISIVTSIVVSVSAGMITYIIKKVFYLNHKITEVSAMVKDLKDEVAYLRERVDNIYDKFFRP